MIGELSMNKLHLLLLLLCVPSIFADQIIFTGGHSFVSSLNGSVENGIVEQIVETDAENVYYGDLSYVLYSNDRFAINQMMYFGLGVQMWAPMTITEKESNIGAFNIPIYASLNFESQEKAFIKPIFRAKIGYNHLWIFNDDKINRGWGNIYGSLSLEAKWLNWVITGIEASHKSFEYKPNSNGDYLTIAHNTIAAYLGICLGLK